MAIRVGVLVALVGALVGCQEQAPLACTQVDAPPRIDPDYSATVLPPNIAPLNFVIREEGVAYRVEIHGSRSDRVLRIATERNTIRMDPEAWRQLLSANAGGELFFDIRVRDAQGGWKRFQPLVNRIATEEVDPFVAYRLINPGYVLWWEMGIYQRDVRTFRETPIFENRATDRNCMNCHSVCWNDPTRMMFHMRARHGGTILARGGEIEKVNTGTKYTMSAGVYPAWHPDGRHIAFSVNKIHQSFHGGMAHDEIVHGGLAHDESDTAAGHEGTQRNRARGDTAASADLPHLRAERTLHVWDSASDLIVYEIETNTVTTSPKVSTKRLENLPAWSADGKYLYFCRGPERDEDTRYDRYRYDLCRIRYDVDTREWGEVEEVLSAAELGASISFPRLSPDGKYLLFCGSQYGYFSIHFASADLYLLDLASGRWQRLDAVNSEQSDSFESWSSNSRWFVFASKRREGLCSRLYFSYVDSLGQAHKPFLLPQEDPTFYDTFVRNYNVPELMRGPVSLNPWDLIRTARGVARKAGFDPDVELDALSGASRFNAE